MTSKEIITRLIDEKVINGEEAYLLINDILRAEMVAINESLGKIKIQETSNPGMLGTNATSFDGYAIGSCLTATTK